MSILIRYVIRSHVGPFLFSFTLLTGLLFLNTIAQRLGQLMGKGLPWSILAEFAVLALPHTVALTLPMSVLVAVLFAFSDLTAENEITAMTGGGVNPVRILVPLVGIGVILAGAMFLFNDRVLPESNHALRKLLVEVNLKSPTFQLREQVVNEVVADAGDRRRVYFLQAVRIDPASSALEDVVIYDLSDPQARRTTYAKRGTMAFSEAQTDLFLTLYDGTVLEVPSNRPGAFQRAEYQEQFLPIKGISNLLERGVAGDFRGDREMSTQMLADSAKAHDRARARYMEETKREAVFAVRRALGWRYQGDSLVPPEAAASAPATDVDDHYFEDAMGPDELSQSLLMTARANALQAEALRFRAVEKRVEIHKKYSIAFACIVFVLIGAPLAVRFPRGGVGMVITVSVVIFALFWMSLIGGETLADNGHVHPALAMWLPNIILLPIGILLVQRISREVATARGGGWDDLLFTLSGGLKKPVLKLLRRDVG